MVANSRVNPNFPIPGIDQSSRGFRDNFSTIKTEIESIQGKNIILAGAISGNCLIDSGSLDVVINTTATNIINSPNYTIATSGVAVIIDTWLSTIYKTVKYIVQVRVISTNHVDVSELLFTYANGVGYISTYGNVNSNGSLGTFGWIINGNNVSLTYNNNTPGVAVKISAVYITN